MQNQKPTYMSLFAFEFPFYICLAMSYFPFPLNAYNAFGHPLFVANMFHITHKQTKFPT